MMEKCKRCGHEWRPRQETKPIECPRCKSYFWAKDYVDPKRKVEETNENNPL